MFIGTGTGFAPLYFQIRALIEKNIVSPVKFVFGVRDSSDLFYQTELQEMTRSLPSLQFTQYMSRETTPDTLKGYVTDAITKENIASYEEFYICGSPAMVSDARTKLESLGVTKEQIRVEQY
jgi:NAD(P)H-flavin reductase